jgi:hypothetical protein
LSLSWFSGVVSEAGREPPGLSGADTNRSI